MNYRLIMAFWISFVAATLVYAVMVLWSLPRIAAAAGGMTPFDMRPTGYSLEESKAFLTVLTDDGRNVYRHTQHMLDTVYPPLLAITLGLGLWIMAPVSAQWLRVPLVLAAVSGMMFDLAENHFVGEMLVSSPVSLDAGLVTMASAATVLKSLFTTIAMAALLALTIWWAWRRWRRV